MEKEYALEQQRDWRLEALAEAKANIKKIKKEYRAKQKEVEPKMVYLRKELKKRDFSDYPELAVEQKRLEAKYQRYAEEMEEKMESERRDLKARW